MLIKMFTNNGIEFGLKECVAFVTHQGTFVTLNSIETQDNKTSDLAMKENYKYHGLLECERKEERINENIVNTYLKKIRKTLSLNSRNLTRSILIF